MAGLDRVAHNNLVKVKKGEAVCHGVFSSVPGDAWRRRGNEGGSEGGRRLLTGFRGHNNH
ncbi:hypothetical protein E2C01_061784 [Portunus trituberculatus]|uniref:Uncharacterized protein n=1 Tax=Portunus trituberculatus TaxID=210409 RepID=A0A5B7HE80_PORTR|nr:hypothetical protein [Portunus trituberculatus]